MIERTIYITEYDEKRLQNLLTHVRSRGGRDRAHITSLERGLESAQIVSPFEIPGDVATMNSQVRVRDLDSNSEKIYTLVFPVEADYDRGRISVLAPIGAALLGYKAGDAVELKAPSGIRRLKIEQVLYQPEAAGDYHL